MTNENAINKIVDGTPMVKPRNAVATKISRSLPVLRVGYAWEIAVNDDIENNYLQKFVIKLHKVTDDSTEVVGFYGLQTLEPYDIGVATTEVLKNKSFARPERTFTETEMSGLGFYTMLID